MKDSHGNIAFFAIAKFVTHTLQNRLHLEAQTFLDFYSLIRSSCVRKIFDLSMGPYESVRKSFERVRKSYDYKRLFKLKNLHSRNTLF